VEKNKMQVNPFSKNQGTYCTLANAWRSLMKKFLVLFLIVATLLLCFPLAEAQTRRRRHRSFWHKHRDKLTVAGTTVAGAAIGGIAGGKKGALIGAGAGAGGGALYTYKLRRRHRRHPR
jgi:uncharacterized membrane protein